MNRIGNRNAISEHQLSVRMPLSLLHTLASIAEKDGATVAGTARRLLMAALAEK